MPFRSVAENVFLGREPKRFGLIDWGRMNREAAAILRRLDIDVDVTRPLYEYSIATQQMVALARALSTEAKLVIMDEPTSSLAEQRGADALPASSASSRARASRSSSSATGSTSSTRSATGSR